MTTACSCPRVLWSAVAQRDLRQALAQRFAAHGPSALVTSMNDLNTRLECLFPDARIVVHAQYVGYRRHDDEYILLVEVFEHPRQGTYVVKFAPHPRLAAELAAWESCKPHGLRHDLVFMMLEPHRDSTGQLVGLIYGDAQQFLGKVQTVALESAFLGAVRHGTPAPSSVAEVFDQLYGRVGQLLYGVSWEEDPDDRHFAFAVPRLYEAMDLWERESSDPWRIRQGVNTWASSERGHFRDPVDYLKVVQTCVAWQLDAPEVGPPQWLPATSNVHAPIALLPRMLRGCAHGDLHGRNVLVALTHERARWPAVFDYEKMSASNLLVWDFVKMETELKIRAYPYLFQNERADKFIEAIQKFEIDLARPTEKSYNGVPWPVIDDRELHPRERLLTLLLALRRQASLHLGSDRSRSRDWLDEYYVGLCCYGVHVARFENLERSHLFGAYISAGVALARYLWKREADLNKVTPDKVTEHLFTSYHHPLELARSWLREGGDRLKDALALLKVLRERYKHVLAIANDLVLALIETGDEREATAELERIKAQFPLVNEETRGRWGKLHKLAGDRARENNDFVRAEECYLFALQEYQKGYEIRFGHYPGINVPTILVILAALAHQRQNDAKSAQYQQQAIAAAEELLRRRGDWPKDLSDDNIWHAATAGEALLLQKKWADAACQYKAALSESNVQPFHRKSISDQVQRVLDAWAKLGERPEAPYDTVEGIVGVVLNVTEP